MSVSGRNGGGEEPVVLTCLPIARRIPAVTPPRPSNNWKRATMGRIEATSSTTSVVSQKQQSAPFSSGQNNGRTLTWIVVEKMGPRLAEDHKHRATSGRQHREVHGRAPNRAAYLHTKLIPNDIRIDALAATPARRAFSSPSRLPTLWDALSGRLSAMQRGTYRTDVATLSANGAW